jgi:hypothetical protein
MPWLPNRTTGYTILHALSMALSGSKGERIFLETPGVTYLVLKKL